MKRALDVLTTKEIEGIVKDFFTDFENAMREKTKVLTIGTNLLIKDVIYNQTDKMYLLPQVIDGLFACVIEFAIQEFYAKGIVMALKSAQEIIDKLEKSNNTKQEVKNEG